MCWRRRCCLRAVPAAQDWDQAHAASTQHGITRQGPTVWAIAGLSCDHSLSFLFFPLFFWRPFVQVPTFIMASYRNSNNVGEAAEGQQHCVQAALITRHPSRLPGACQPADNLLWQPVLSVLRACLLGLCNSRKLDQQRQGMASAAQGRGTPCNQTQSLGGRPGSRLGQDRL